MHTDYTQRSTDKILFFLFVLDRHYLLRKGERVKKKRKARKKKRKKEKNDDEQERQHQLIRVYSRREKKDTNERCQKVQRKNR